MGEADPLLSVRRLKVGLRVQRGKRLAITRLRMDLPEIGRFSVKRRESLHLAHLVEGCQLDGCDATLWYSDRLKAAVERFSKSKDCSFATRPAISKGQLCQLVRTFSFCDVFTLRAGIGWISPLSRKVGSSTDEKEGPI